MAEKILLVEDEEKLARMVELELRYEGYEVEKAFDGRTGLERALSGAVSYTHLTVKCFAKPATGKRATNIEEGRRSYS